MYIYVVYRNVEVLGLFLIEENAISLMNKKEGAFIVPYPVQDYKQYNNS